VSTFYLLPPRPYLGECFAHYLQGLFPGLTWDPDVWPNLAEGLASTATCRRDVFVVYREDLPEEEDLPQALVNGFGAEAGDEIIELRASGRPGAWVVQRWHIAQAA
jgi:hypothetical protein